MRFIAFILIVLMLITSFVPCADVHLGNTCRSTGVRMSAIQHNDSKDNQCNDTCSPFCSCSCCAGFTITNHDIAMVPELHFSHKESYTTLVLAQTLDISLSVWQPPQLS